MDEKPSLYRRQRERVLRVVDAAGRWISERRAVSIPVNTAVRIYERDRDVFGSVLGSAVALRIFLFALPLLLLLLGVATLLVGEDILPSDVSRDLGLSGSVAAEVDQAMQARQTTALLLIGSGAVGSVWAGRGLTRVLAAVSASAWQLDARRSRARFTAILSVSGLFALIVVASMVVNWIQDETGLVIGATSMLGVIAIYAAGWFALSLALPRATPDPGALLPGAGIVGLTIGLLQGISQFWLPNQIESESQVLGGLGVTVVALGWLFITGRVMVTSLVIDAVIFEEVGSVSRFVFDLPLVRRIPARWPKVAEFFDLPERTSP